VAARHRRLAQRPCRPSHAPARGRGATQAICWLPSSQPNVKDRTCRALFHRGPGRVCWGVCSSRRCYTGDVHGPCPKSPCPGRISPDRGSIGSVFLSACDAPIMVSTCLIASVGDCGATSESTAESLH
jgi:hypothetical protein